MPTDPNDALAAAEPRVAAAKAGDRDALTGLVAEHKPWIYNLALRMVWSPVEAEDATQDVLVKMLRGLKNFEGRSQFRTWLYRIAVNHLINRKKGMIEQSVTSFEEYGAGLDSAPDAEVPGFATVERDLLVEEAKIGCMTGMLLCLDRDQRIAYLLGSVFAFEDTLCAEILEIKRDAFRKRLSRARQDLHHFMQNKCGLVDASNPCRCSRKTKAFIDRGFVDPERLKFARARARRLVDVATAGARSLFKAVTEDAPRLFREHPFVDGPDTLERVQQLIATSGLELE